MKKKRHYTKPLFRAQREREIVETEEAASGEAAEVGETVIRRPATFGRGRMKGRVVYVHPAGRFHVVEFELPRGGTLRECFAGAGK